LPIPDENIPGIPQEDGEGILYPGLHTAGIIHGFNKIALGTTLDDVAADVLRRAFSGRIAGIAGKPAGDRDTVRTIRPFMLIPAREAMQYARLNLPGILFTADIITGDDTRRTIRQVLDWYTEKHPSAQYALAAFSESLSRCTPVKPENTRPRYGGVIDHGN
jgi:tRNA(Ile)-lysidine synthase TilS/MesJ